MADALLRRKHSEEPDEPTWSLKKTEHTEPVDRDEKRMAPERRIVHMLEKADGMVDRGSQ